MTEDVANRSPDLSAPATPSDGQAPRPQKRGKRNRSKSARSASAPPVSASEPGERKPPSPPGQRGGRRGAPRSGASGFGDNLARYVCDASAHGFPERFPVQHRRGLAAASLGEVDRRNGELLLCNQLHEGACRWPDGELVSQPPDAAPHDELETDSPPEQA